MVLTPAEKQRLYRERKKTKERHASLSVTNIFRRPFFETLEYQSTLFEETLSIVGIEAPYFEDDTGPEAFVINNATGDADDFFKDAKGSLGRAEVIVGCMIDAAADLAGHINSYKKSEIRKRISEIQASDLSDTERKTVAFEEVTKLNKMLEQLSKDIRWTFPQWKATYG